MNNSFEGLSYQLNQDAPFVCGLSRYGTILPPSSQHEPVARWANKPDSISKKKDIYHTTIGNNGQKHATYRTRVVSFDVGVVEELDQFHLASAQRDAEVDRLLRRCWKSSQGQVVVKEAQLQAVEAQPGCGLLCVQRLVLEAHTALETGQR